MSKPQEKYPIITSAEYFAKQDKNEPYRGYVVYPDGKVTMALSEVVIKSNPVHLYVDSKNKIGVDKYSNYNFFPDIKYHETLTPYTFERDNTYVDTSGYYLKMISTTQTESIRRNIKEIFLKSLICYYQRIEFDKSQKEQLICAQKYNDPSEIDIDVSNPRNQSQYNFAKFKKKIEDGTIKKENLPADFVFSWRRDVDTYFACFDPKDPNYRKFWDTYHIGQATGFEAYLPVWGNVRNSVDAFQRGYDGDGAQYYFDGIGYFCLAAADVLSLGMITEAMMGVKAGGMITTPPARIAPVYFPTIRGGYGVFGKNGLNFRNYKIEAMYQHKGKLKGGTIFSIKESSKGGNLFRIDYHRHNDLLFHYHYRYIHNGKQYGSANHPFSIF